MSRFLFYGIFIQCMLASVLLAGDGVAQKTSIEDIYLSLDLNDITLKEAFEVIGDKTNFDFAFNDARVNENTKISVSAKNESLADVLRSISKNKKLRFKRVDEVIHVNRKNALLFGAIEVEEVIVKQSQVSGKVTTAEDGEPLPGVSVIVEGTSQGTVTDIDGNYTIEVPNNSRIQFSYIGYLAQTVDVANRSEINISLEADVQQLEEVVVTALGIEKSKKALGYSVTEVKGEEFTQAREINLANALTGKIAGVNVSNVASGPAGSSRVVIRGGSSIGGNNQPLYVIDGVPMDNTQLGNAGMWGGQDWGDGISSINPDDIETMSVLKGNTAAALYGSRASNGVILITTKKGTNRKGLGVEFNSNFVLDKYIDNYDFQTSYGHGNRGLKPLDAEEGLEYGSSSWGAKLDGTQVPQFDGVSRPYSYTGDNREKFYETGTTFTNTIALLGGDANHNYRFSASNLDNSSIIPNSGLTRNTFNMNIGGKFKDIVELNAKAQYIKEEVDNRPRLSDSPGNANFTAVFLPPSINVEDLKGTTGKLGAEANGTELQHQSNLFAQNPYWASHQFSTKDQRDRLISSALVKVNFTDWLYLQGRIGMDWYTSRRTSITPYGTGYSPFGQMSEDEFRVRETNMDFLLGANKTFGDIGLNAFVGGNSMRKEFERIGSSASRFNIPFFHVISNGANQSASQEIRNSGINSVFGSVEVSYKNYLFLNATARNDWFSTLNPNSNSILYPSVGASLVLSDAVSLPSAISFAKVRASWAEVGGGTDPYRIDLTRSLVGQGHLGQALGRISQNSIPNQNLKPLTSAEIEVGLDMRFFNGRLGIDLAYYDRKTTDDIVQASVSEGTGYSSATVNVGEISNKGVELLLTGTPIRSSFVWDISLNLAKNNSEIVNLGDGLEVLRLPNGEARSRNVFIEQRIGEQFGVITGFRHKRINGQLVYDDNGLPIRDDKVEILGNGVHDLTAGLTNSFAYKNFNMSFLIDFRSGGDLYSGTNSTAYGNGLHKATLEGRESGLSFSGVDQEGVPTDFTIAAEDVQDYYSRLTSISEYFVYDASFIKLRQLIFGYTFPKTIIDKTPFTNLNLSFVGRNLWLIKSNVDNIDPESTYNNSNAQGLEWLGVPQSRSFGFNLSAKF